MARALGSALALLAALVGAEALAPGRSRVNLSRRNVLCLGASLPAVWAGQPAFAGDEITPSNCKAECFKECNVVAPGNKQYCATQCDSYCDEAAKADPIDTGMPAQADLDKNLGIFGDSGVGYSRGTEDLFATAFGATRQNKNVNKANPSEFAGEVGNAFKAALTGGK